MMVSDRIQDRRALPKRRKRAVSARVERSPLLRRDRPADQFLTVTLMPELKLLADELVASETSA